MAPDGQVSGSCPARKLSSSQPKKSAGNRGTRPANGRKAENSMMILAQAPHEKEKRR
jgi:hypothetical protein